MVTMTLILKVNSAFAAPLCIEFLASNKVISFAKVRSQTSNEFRIKTRSVLEEKPIGLVWTLNNIFGSHEVIVSQTSKGLQLAVIPKTHDNPKYIKSLLQVLLGNYFGDHNVSYPVKKQFTDRSEHLFVQINPQHGGRTEVLKNLDVINKNLTQMPARLITTQRLILENPEAQQSLKALKRLYFPEISEKAFIDFAAQFIPYFVSKLSVIENVALNKEIFSAKLLSSDPIQERVLSRLFQSQINLLSLRLELRNRFILELSNEITTKDFDRSQSVFRIPEKWKLTEWEKEREIFLNSVYEGQGSLFVADIFLSSSLSKMQETKFLVNSNPTNQLEVSERVLQSMDVIGPYVLADFSFNQTSLSQLILNRNLMQKLVTLKDIQYVEDLARYSAKEIVEKLSLSRHEAIELLIELDVHAIHLHFDPIWDKGSYQLHKDLPQFYDPKPFL